MIPDAIEHFVQVPYYQVLGNEQVRRKIQAAIGEYDELLTLVKKWKLKLSGHVSRSSETPWSSGKSSSAMLQKGAVRL